MTFPVQVILDERNLKIRIAEIRDWLNKHGIDAGAFQYSMAADHVELRIDFITLKDAADFAEAFDGIVYGIKRTAPI